MRDHDDPRRALLDHGPVLTADTLRTIVSLTEDGMTVRAIAEHLGISQWTVQRGRTVTGTARPLFDGTPQPIDEVAVLRATWGDRVELNATERTEAVRVMNARGMSAAQIARMLNVTRRTVERHVAKVRAA